jgi:D-glycero-alpha-D-manno-heptose-7-phosphate kinase
LKLENFIIKTGKPIRVALELIGRNNHGFVAVVNSQDVVISIATEGDIRRTLLEDGDLESPVDFGANEKFVWADEKTPREVLLKQLDHRIKAIPVLDDKKRLVSVVSRDFLPVVPEAPVFARSRSPVRISFGGGGSDLTEYFAGESGAVINTTVSLYSHCLLKKRSDSRVIINSRDLDMILEAESLEKAIEGNGKLGLIKAALRAIHPNFGFELYISSDFPPGSGLGGSAVVVSAILGCFNQFRHDKWDNYELAELAFQAERLYLGVSGGWQDQYATVFGGLNFLELKYDQNIVSPLRIPKEVLLELEENLILCDTGFLHDSNDIHLDQSENMNKADVRERMHDAVTLTYRMRNDLLRGNLSDFGKCLDEGWNLKKQFSKKITNSFFDEVYNGARNAGALGGKILGAGGGGYFLFYVPPIRNFEVVSYLKSKGLKTQRIKFEESGLESWTTRQKK